MNHIYMNDINSCHIPWDTRSLVNVMLGQLVDNYPACYETKGVITVYSTFSHCILSRAKLVY
jgi:hypothetical protein